MAERRRSPQPPPSSSSSSHHVAASVTAAPGAARSAGGGGGMGLELENARLRAELATQLALVAMRELRDTAAYVPPPAPLEQQGQGAGVTRAGPPAPASSSRAVPAAVAAPLPRLTDVLARHATPAAAPAAPEGSQLQQQAVTAAACQSALHMKDAYVAQVRQEQGAAA